MSNRLFQSVVHQMRDTIDCVIGVIDETATIIACSELAQIGTTNEFVSLDLGESHDVFVRDGYTYKPFGAHMKPDYAVFVEGTDEVAAKYASILAITLSSIKQYYDEKYDRNNFIKNVVLDNVLPGDVHVKARELHFSSDIYRVVLLIRIVSSNDVPAYDVIQNLFPDKNKDFVFNITESDIVLVKEVSSGVESKDLEKLASKVYLIHRRDEFRGEPGLLESVKEKDNIELVLNSTVEELVGDAALETVVVKNKITGELRDINVQGLFVAIGQEPDNGAFASEVKLDDKGYVVADESCLTDTPGIFVAGDCRTKQVRQLTTAASDGAIAALAACAYLN